MGSPRATRLPTDLQIVIALITLTGVASLVDMVSTYWGGGSKIDVGVVTLLLAVCLVCRSRIARILAVGLARVSIAVCVVGICIVCASKGSHVTVEYPFMEPRPAGPYEALAGFLVLFALICWSEHVLTRRDVVALFARTPRPTAAP